MLPPALPPHRRVLVVDDDDLTRRTLARQLGRLGYTAYLAADGVHALRLASAHDFDVLLTDLMMPAPDGFDLMARMAERFDAMSFVLMTAKDDLRGHGSRAADGRLTAVLTKPLHDQDLGRALDHAFQVAANRRALTGQQLTRVRLLLLEDSPTDALLLRHSLEVLGGFEVTLVTRLADAVRLLHTETFDTMITDLTLPDARGLDAVLRMRECAPEATLLVCSSVADEAMALRVIELGAQDFVVKGTADSEALGRTIRFARVRRQAERRLAALAWSDALTGLANRAAFTERLDHALAQAKRQRTPLGVMFIDLDGFKVVNDTRGHDAGDALLKQVAGRIRDCVREYDLVARFGGDEFAVIAPNLNGDVLERAAERIARAVAAPVQLEGAHGHVTVTASIGVASFPYAAEEAVLLVKLADEAMYLAKRAGKGCVRSAGPTSGAPRAALAT